MNELITVEELAEELKVPKTWIYSRTRAKSIPALKVGKYYRFYLRDVLAWLKKENEK